MVSVSLGFPDSRRHGTQLQIEEDWEWEKRNGDKEKRDYRMHTLPPKTSSPIIKHAAVLIFLLLFSTAVEVAIVRDGRRVEAEGVAGVL